MKINIPILIIIWIILIIIESNTLFFWYIIKIFFPISESCRLDMSSSFACYLMYDIYFNLFLILYIIILSIIYLFDIDIKKLLRLFK